MTDINRRDFLKLAGIAWAAISPLKVLAAGEFLKPPYQLPINFDFFDHNLYTEQLSERTALVLGETNLYHLQSRRNGVLTDKDLAIVKTSMPDRVKDWLAYNSKSDGFGSSDMSQSFELVALTSLRSKGIELAATDMNHANSVLIETENQFDQVYKELNQKAIKISVPIAGILTALTMYYGAILVERADSKKKKSAELAIAGLDFALAVDFVIQHLDEVMKILGDDFSKQIVKCIDEKREMNMAYNTRLIELILGSNESLRDRLKLGSDNKQALFFASLGHLQAKTYYRRGALWLSDRLQRQIKEEVYLGKRLLNDINQGKIKDLTEAEFLEFFTYVTVPYHFPVASFFEYDDYKLAGNLDLAPTARLLFWTELLKQYRDDTAN
jgi:hypothetical protein